MKTHTLEPGEAYLKALNIKSGKDWFDVHPALKFRTPLIEVSNREHFLSVTQCLLANIKGLKVKSKFSPEKRTIFTYDLIFEGPIRTTRTGVANRTPG